MRQKVITLLSMFAVMFMGLSPAHSATNQELQRQISELSGKVEKMRTKARNSGGDGHSSKTSVHGYGELHGQFNDSGPNRMDQHRFVIGVHSQLSDWITLNAEIDFEHAAQKLEFEFGYLDFALSPAFNIRAGQMLIPVGHINEFHEPNKFLTVERPNLHKYVIPTTWGSAGGGVYGTLGGGTNYRIYVVNSLKGTDSSTKDYGESKTTKEAGYGGCSLQFKGDSGIRSGRGESNKRCFDNVALTGRVEHMLSPGVNIAYSFYAGNTGHNINNIDGFLFLNEADIQIRQGAWEMNSTIVNINIDDTAETNKLHNANGNGGKGNVGERIFGWNVQAGVHLLQLAGQTTKHDLIAHVMYEDYNLQEDMESAVEADRALTSKGDVHIWHYGLTYKPIPEVAIKIDHQRIEYQNEGLFAATKKEDATDNTSNIGIAYMY